jgi:hypothetical protein
LNATQQLALGHAYNCNGTCAEGYNTTNGYSCDCRNLRQTWTYDVLNPILDLNECDFSVPVCGNGVCTNLDGSYTCNCTSGYRFNGTTCVSKFCSVEP